MAGAVADDRERCDLPQLWCGRPLAREWQGRRTNRPTSARRGVRPGKRLAAVNHWNLGWAVFHGSSGGDCTRAMDAAMTGSLAASRTKDIKQTMLLGLSKAPLRDIDPLATLALVAMREKFVRPHPPAGPADASTPYASYGKLLSDEFRLLLLKLLSERDVGADWHAVDIFRAIKAHDLRLHPFDYARLEYFIERYAAEFGPEERAWLAVVRPARKQDDIYPEGPLTDATLPQASRAQKLQFLRALRKEDAGKARKLVETLLPNEPANVRAEFVGLLALKLGDDDRPFLESLAQDRAQSVRDAASMLLGCIRGTDAFAKRIERLKDHLQIKTEGLLRKHQVLKYTGPTSGNSGDVAEAQRALLKDLRLKDIADALGVTEQDLLEAASRSQRIGISAASASLQRREGRVVGTRDPARCVVGRRKSFHHDRIPRGDPAFGSPGQTGSGLAPRHPAEVMGERARSECDQSNLAIGRDTPSR